MINLSQAALENLIIHRVGNKLLEESVLLSDEETDLSSQPDLPEILRTYFTSAFKEPVYYHFHHVSSLELNEIYTIAAALFKSRKGFAKKIERYCQHPV